MEIQNPKQKPRLKDSLGKVFEQYPPYFREYLRKYEEDPRGRIFAPLAESYRRLGNLEEAIRISLAGLKEHPDYHGARITLAKCYLDRRQYVEAKVELEKVVHAVPENFLAQKLLGEAYEALGEIKACIHCFKMALLLSPQDVQLSEKVFFLERKLNADEVSQVAPTPPPKEPSSIFSNAADFLSHEPSEDEEGFKVETLNRVFDAQSHQEEITTKTLADLYLSQGRFEIALRIFEKLNRESPSADLMAKISTCKNKLGVQKDDIVRVKKIDFLRDILKRVQHP